MQIILNNQDIINAVCVYTAVLDNDDVIDGIEPGDVNATIWYEDGNYFAKGRIYGANYRFNEQDIKNAIAVYLRAYHCFDEQSLAVNLTYYADRTEFGADVVVVVA